MKIQAARILRRGERDRATRVVGAHEDVSQHNLSCRAAAHDDRCAADVDTPNCL